MVAKLVISLCDYSTVFVQPWAKAGYECWCIDLQHKKSCRDGNIIKIKKDIMNFKLPNRPISFVAAFPPCTDVAVSGARYFQDKGLGRLIYSLTLFYKCVKICNQSNAPFFIENPVSTVSSYYRKPDHIFHPHEYAGYLDDGSSEQYTKKTCLWTGNGFVLPDKKILPPVLGSRIIKLPPSSNRVNIRSKTPEGFSKAVYLYNKDI